MRKFLNSEMNILLIWPPDIYGKYNRLGTPWLPIGLASLASYLKKHRPEINIRIACATLEKLNFSQMVEIVKNNKWDVIGISYITVQAPYAFALSKIIKETSKALLVHGGIHPTTNVEEAVSFADICVLHEGEKTFLELIDTWKSSPSKVKKIKGIAFKEKDQVVKTPMRELIMDLDEIPLPAYDLLPMKNYDGRLHVTDERSLDIMESRGCPYDCSFCVSPLMWQRKVRWHSPAYIIRYMKYAIDNYGISNFHFHGDNFMLIPSFVKEVCELINKENLKVKWCALTRAKHVNDYSYLLPLMKEAGCVGIEIGIDSAESKALEAINKNQDTSEVIKAFKNQKKAGMTPLFTLMGFNPMESILGYYQQQRTVFKDILNYNYVHPGQTSTPYPGTKYWSEKEKFGVVLADDWEGFDHKLIPFVPFSLLAGKPQSIRSKLKLNEIFIILGTYLTYRVDLFTPRLNWLENLGRGIGYLGKLKKYYSLCSGKYTVEEISEYLSQEESMLPKEGLRFVAFATLMCAKMGLVRDMNSEKMRGMKVEPLFRGLKEEIGSLWQYLFLGISFNLLNLKEKSRATCQ